MGSFWAQPFYVIVTCGDLKYVVIRVWIMIEHGRSNQVAVTFQVKRPGNFSGNTWAV
jgi:hypothetical protein